MKKHKLIGLTLASLGIILFMAGVQYSSLLLVAGVAWFVVGRVYD